jgi:hypothetical protein
MWAMNKYRMGQDPATFAHEARPKKKIRGYERYPCLFRLTLAHVPPIQMGSVRTVREAYSVSSQAIVVLFSYCLALHSPGLIIHLNLHELEQMGKLAFRISGPQRERMAVSSALGLFSWNERQGYTGPPSRCEPTLRVFPQHMRRVQKDPCNCVEM